MPSSARRPPSAAEIRRKMLAIVNEGIAERGYQVFWTYTETPAGNLPFAYTVGLTETFDHPEVLIYGIGQGDAGGILSTLAYRIKEGERFEGGTRTAQLTETGDSLFIAVPWEAHLGVCNAAHLRYADELFHVVQLVWPDPEGRFWFEPGFDPQYAKYQPILGLLPS